MELLAIVEIDDGITSYNIVSPNKRGDGTVEAAMPKAIQGSKSSLHRNALDVGEWHDETRRRVARQTNQVGHLSPKSSLR